MSWETHRCNYIGRLSHFVPQVHLTSFLGFVPMSTQYFLVQKNLPKMKLNSLIHSSSSGLSKICFVLLWRHTEWLCQKKNQTGDLLNYGNIIMHNLVEFTNYLQFLNKNIAQFSQITFIFSSSFPSDMLYLITFFWNSSYGDSQKDTWSNFKL